MTAMAAARLGYRCHIFAPEPDSPAADVASGFTCAGYDDVAALRAFAEAVDVVTLEFENVPVAALDHLAGLRPGRPSAAVLRVTQDRLAEKDFVVGLGIPVTAYAAIGSAADLRRAMAELGPGVLKATRLGYDGKGQVRVGARSDLAAAVASLRQDVLIHEAWVDFALELSVITARSPMGAVASYVPVENRHRHHILDVTLAPAELAPQTAAEAVSMAERIAVALELEGLLAVEMFLTRDGRLLVNELAPRPHNSGHWTIDACAVSQFEQQVRAVCGLPLGDPAHFADAVMTNLIGTDVARWPELLAEPGARLHLYGKREARPGRKMGHVTRLRR
jgi:5-(carboxyamino)imidazole ribonucleotide synthase